MPPPEPPRQPTAEESLPPQKRKRRHSDNDMGPSGGTLMEGGSARGSVLNKRSRPGEFKDTPDLIAALRAKFDSEDSIDFSGCFFVQDGPGNDRNRVKAVIDEIWRATGYKFTIKDHPQLKDGFKTRLWCAQDEIQRARKHNGSLEPRVNSAGEVLGKTRYPCKSSLQVTCREGYAPNERQVTVRIHHHFKHPPFTEQLPPEAPSMLVAAQPQAPVYYIPTMAPQFAYYQVPQGGANGQAPPVPPVPPPTSNAPPPPEPQQMPDPPTSAHGPPTSHPPATPSSASHPPVPPPSHPSSASHTSSASHPPVAQPNPVHPTRVHPSLTQPQHYPPVPPPEPSPARPPPSQQAQSQAQPLPSTQPAPAPGPLPLPPHPAFSHTPVALPPHLQAYRTRMLSLITTMRDFCGGLEYQLQFNDFRMLEQLETEGASFFRFMEACLQRERPAGAAAGSSGSAGAGGSGGTSNGSASQVSELLLQVGKKAKGFVQPASGSTGQTNGHSRQGSGSAAPTLGRMILPKGYPGQAPRHSSLVNGDPIPLSALGSQTNGRASQANGRSSQSTGHASQVNGHGQDAAGTSGSPVHGVRSAGS
ncbi:hypothetical protein EV714DRAFT_279792 [Schizophyllum commune]